MQTCLWFDGQAEEAATFYTSLFANSKLGKVVRYGDVGPGQAGQVMTVEFEIDGHKFLGLNGGPNYQFTPAVSFMIYCDKQAEIDKYWDGILANGGSEMMCGWITDKWGVAWQIVPTMLGKLMTEPMTEKREAVMHAFMQMKKFDIAALEAARDGAVAA